jgi:hypothetical protein
MTVYRSFIVWAGGIVLVLGLFLIFVAAGWPGKVNECVKGPTTDTCYCEGFSHAQAISGAPGVRQPTNTWSNLYAIATSLLVAWVVYYDRSKGDSTNPIRSRSWIPDLCVFAVQFLGLGSMWFHGSIKQWGGVTDQLSMFVYSAFLIFYTVRRLWDNEWFFWFAWGGTVIAVTAIAAALSKFDKISLVLILIQVAIYLAFELWTWARSEWKNWALGKPSTRWMWCLAVFSILMATLFWKLSETGGPMCDPKSGFQGHGLLWHPLAGVMAVLLYFYWRQDDNAARYNPTQL